MGLISFLITLSIFLQIEATAFAFSEKVSEKILGLDAVTGKSVELSLKGILASNGNSLKSKVTSEIAANQVAAEENKKTKATHLATVVVFLSTRCPCSASHQAALNDLRREFEPKGFQFVGIHSNANESWEEARQYFEKSGLSFPVVHDPKSRIADEYEAFKTPHAYVVNPELKVLFQGGVDDSKLVVHATKFYLKEALGAIAQGLTPEKQQVRVVGCEIARP